jgi:hypothetical protein
MSRKRAFGGDSSAGSSVLGATTHYALGAALKCGMGHEARPACFLHILLGVTGALHGSIIGEKPAVDLTFLFVSWSVYMR